MNLLLPLHTRSPMVLDKNTIEQLKQHNEAVFESIYHETKKGVYAIIFAIVKDYDRTEDILQDVYMRMLIKIDQYKVGSNFKNWLLQIAKNQAIDYYRRTKKLASVDDEQIDFMIDNNQETPDEKSSFESMLECLDETEKTIVLLKVVDEMSHQEIARIIHKPLGTVLWLYQRALSKLKKYRGDM